MICSCFSCIITLIYVKLLQQGDDPPYLPVGTAVSAKYKGAFCEAKVSKVVRVVKCKVHNNTTVLFNTLFIIDNRIQSLLKCFLFQITYRMGLGTATVPDEHIRGPLLRVGHTVEAWHSEEKDYVEATITKIQDCSQYTVGKIYHR